MKKLFIVLIAFLFLFSFAVPVDAKSCISPKGGWARCPDGDGMGSIGLEGYAFGEGWFDELTVTTKVTRIPVQLSSIFVDGSGPITNSTNPNLTTTDNIGKILYDNSGETAELQFDWFPAANFTGMTLNMMVNSSTATPTGLAVAWSIFVYDNSVAFGTEVVQTGETVPITGSNMSTTSRLVTLTLDETGIAAITAGTSTVTIAAFNATTHASATLEISDIWINETGF